METLMTDEHKESLVTKRTEIVNNIRMDYIMNDLESSKVLMKQDILIIKAKIGHEQAECFLDMLCKGPDSSYETFITVLKNNHQQHIANILDSCVDEKTKIYTRENRSSASLLQTNPFVKGVITVDGGVWGITVLGNELFVIPEDFPSHVHVYNTNNFKLSRHFEIPNSGRLIAIVGSSHYSCLFISDTKLYQIHRYNLFNNTTTQWSVNGQCYGLSLTCTRNVLVSLLYPSQIIEYTPDGSLIREINLDITIGNPQHSVQLSNDRFVVSHGYTGLVHRVCIVDNTGDIIQSYGGYRGSGLEQLNAPRHLAVDRHDKILVADEDNSRVLVLSSSLSKLVTNIGVPRLRKPWALHLDGQNHRLYIGEQNDTGRVFILGI